MNRITNAQLLGQLRWRYATKQFDPAGKISAEDWATLEEALILTPSSCGLQPWKFIVVTDQPTKDKLVPVSWGQKQVADCSRHVVFAFKKNIGEKEIDELLDHQVEVRGGSREALAGYRSMMMGLLVNGPGKAFVNEWAVRQVYIALGNFMTSAALLGIDTCPMEGIEPEKYDAILGLELEGYATTVACAAGYRAAGDKYASLAKVRFGKETIIRRI